MTIKEEEGRREEIVPNKVFSFAFFGAYFFVPNKVFSFVFFGVLFVGVFLFTYVQCMFIYVQMYGLMIEKLFLS